MTDSLPVMLNVYKIAENSFINSLGFEIFHTAIEYDNNEFAFGYINKANMSGIYDIQPMSFDEGLFVESINLGKVKRRDFFTKLDKIKLNYMGNSYNILTKNCNHFTRDFVKNLLNIDLPKKYTSFLKFGEFLRKILFL